MLEKRILKKSFKRCTKNDNKSKIKKILPGENFINMRAVIAVKKMKECTERENIAIPITGSHILDTPRPNDRAINAKNLTGKNIFAISVKNKVGLWNINTHEEKLVVEYKNGDRACALAWTPEAKYILGVGTRTGKIELYDCSTMQKIRNLTGCIGTQVQSLDWNCFLCTTGCSNGYIYHHDVRQDQSEIIKMKAHNSIVSNVKWSPDFKHLATSGRDNKINVYYYIYNKPLISFKAHSGTIKALEWCPWSSNILASGGFCDRYLKLWDINSKMLVNLYDTHFKIHALLWSKQYRNLITGHEDHMTVWQYPTLIPISEMSGYGGYIKQMVMLDKESHFITSASNNLLKLWDCKENLKSEYILD